jgi:predicted RNA-binding Zn ribbon-like protein
LAPVHDFLTTRADVAIGPDLLANGFEAEEWAMDAVRNWSARRGVDMQPPSLADRDAAKLRELRDSLRSLVGGASSPTVVLAGAGEFTIDAAGEGRWMPVGEGWRWCWGAILGEILLSQHAKTWSRLKHCGNGACGATFYDATWNSGSRWHNARTCDPALQQ